MSGIQTVIEELNAIVDKARIEKAAHGYFAALYLQMTEAVRDGISGNAFDDGARMEKLDVFFANRYLHALLAWQRGGTPTRTWAHAFEESRRNDIAVIQHLLCGIHAHINLDLGIAAALTSPGPAIYELESDFMKINSVIDTLMVKVQVRLGKMSWPMQFLDELTGDTDSKIANFSIAIARDAAWKFAVDLALMPESVWPAQIQLKDQEMLKLARRISEPGFVANLVLWPVKWFEKGTVSDKIDVLLGR
ncbi:MAG: hypothetical protein JNL57_11130 [Bacteroidetes bacterium]|nr:hypothetical protein [Bacteroidota bacterium]